MSKPNIAIITGTRAEFGIWRPVLRAIEVSKKLRLQLIVTGMHLQREFGYTLHDIQASGIPIAATVPMYKPNDTPADSLARGTAGLAKAFAALEPDLVMVLGDRLEALATANAALACQLPLAHLHGGESAPAQWDEQIRHAVTKIAHLHFCATRKAAHRIAQMGEDPKTIHPVGAPALDTAAAFVIHPSLAWKRKAGGAGQAILLLHPSSPDDHLEHRRTLSILAALRARKIPFAALGPNNDPGHAGILRAYHSQRVHLVMSLPQRDFFQRFATRDLLIGNSSAGILEAASLGIPVINLGDRQKGRERNPNVIDVPWSTGRSGIEKAIHHALTNQPFRQRVAKRKNLYGDGHASERILHILESLTFPLPTTKQFHDH